jgi:hypothetical protein
MLTGTPKMLDFLGLSYQKLREQHKEAAAPRSSENSLM